MVSICWWGACCFQVSSNNKAHCYCRFINEACGNEDWLVHRANWTGGKKTSQKGESHVQVWVQLSPLLRTRKDRPPPPQSTAALTLGSRERDRRGEGMVVNSLRLPVLYPFSFLMNTGQHFWAPGSQLDGFPKTMTARHSFVAEQAAFPGSTAQA